MTDKYTSGSIPAILQVVLSVAPSLCSRTYDVAHMLVFLRFGALSTKTATSTITVIQHCPNISISNSHAIWSLDRIYRASVTSVPPLDAATSRFKRLPRAWPGLDIDPSPSLRLRIKAASDQRVSATDSSAASLSTRSSITSRGCPP